MILYVARYHPALTETFVRDEVRALHRAGVPVELAAFDPRDTVPVEPIGAPVHMQPHRWGWVWALPRLIIEWARRPARVSPRVLWLASIIRRSRRVHVHFAGEAAEWTRMACQRAGTAYSVTVHAVDLYKPRPALASVLRDAVVVVAMTEWNQRLLAERWGVTARLVRFGLDLEGTALAEPTTNSTIVSVGRNVPKKGLDLVVGLAHALGPDAQVQIISDLDPSPPAQVLPLCDHAEVRRVIASAGLFVLPCRRAPDGDMDGLPVVLVEAMAAGVPVVTTSISGIPELVDAEVGWVVPPDDPQALLAAVREALANPQERGRRGAVGRRRVAERGYSIARLVAEMREILVL
ncbi:MAG: glycosyltransferase [Myxococcales bacterium]|nr:glycosyltransferase [Myxococcales bacterium]